MKDIVEIVDNLLAEARIGSTKGTKDGDSWKTDPDARYDRLKTLMGKGSNKKRKCLQCGKMFASSHHANRRCPDCKEKDQRIGRKGYETHAFLPDASSENESRKNNKETKRIKDESPKIVNNLLENWKNLSSEEIIALQFLNDAEDELFFETDIDFDEYSGKSQTYVATHPFDPKYWESRVDDEIEYQNEESSEPLSKEKILNFMEQHWDNVAEEKREGKDDFDSYTKDPEAHFGVSGRNF